MLVGMGKYYLFNKLLQSLIQETQCERPSALIEGEQGFSEIWDNMGGIEKTYLKWEINKEWVINLNREINSFAL